MSQLIKRHLRRHECRPPINWFGIRFGAGTEYACDCGELWLYDGSPKPHAGADGRPALFEMQTENRACTWWKFSDYDRRRRPGPVLPVSDVTPERM